MLLPDLGAFLPEARLRAGGVHGAGLHPRFDRVRGEEEEVVGHPG